MDRDLRGDLAERRLAAGLRPEWRNRGLSCRFEAEMPSEINGPISVALPVGGVMSLRANLH